MKGCSLSIYCILGLFEKVKYEAMLKMTNFFLFIASYSQQNQIQIETKIVPSSALFNFNLQSFYVKPKNLF